MAAIDWAPTLAALDAKLATVHNPHLSVGTRIRNRLNALGTRHDRTPGNDSAG